MIESSLERKFALYWLTIKGLELDKEVKLVPGRRFQVDFIHQESRVVIELEGLKGRHQHIRGFIDDCEKYLEITLLGYVVIRLTTEQVNVKNLERIADFCRQRMRVVTWFPGS